MYLLFYTFAIVCYIAWADGQHSGSYVYDIDVKGSFKLHAAKNWRDARFKCYEEGAELASPDSDEMITAMASFLQPPNQHLPERVFTGIHDTYSTGHFQTINGIPFKRMLVQWVPGTSPNSENAKEPSCMTMQYNGMLAYAKCTDQFPFLCYKREFTCGTEGSGYKYERRTSSCYKVHDQKLSWSRAFAVCAEEDAHLAIINGEPEVEVLKELFPSTDGIHAGFNDWNGHNTWMTIDGKTLKEAGYEKWAEGEPNNFENSQYCGNMYKTGTLDDINCDNHSQYFICEKQPGEPITIKS